MGISDQKVSIENIDVSKLIKKVTLIALLVNIILSGIKISAGILAKSQAVFADGVHSLSDCVTDIVILAGVNYWSKPADEDHPFGHQKIETIISVIIGLLLAISAFVLAIDAILSINSNSPAPGFSAIIAAALSIILKETLYRYTIYKSKIIGSVALKANAWHQRSDVFSSIPVFISVGVAYFYPALIFVDKIAAILVSGFILYSAWDIIRPNIADLADKAASPVEIATIKSTVLGIKDVKGVHAIRTRMYAGKIYVDLHVLVNGKLSIIRGHDIATLVQIKLKKRDNITDVLVHIEPFDDHYHTIN